MDPLDEVEVVEAPEDPAHERIHALAEENKKLCTLLARTIQAIHEDAARRREQFSLGLGDEP